MALAFDHPVPETLEARRILAGAHIPDFTYGAAQFWGNTEPAPATKVFYDPSLRNTGTLAYYRNPKEVVELSNERERPALEAALLREYGSLEPAIGLNPDILNLPEGYRQAVIHHEQGHAAQPKGKMQLMNIYARTPLGNIPLGEMLVEGGNEYALERRGVKPPSRYFDEANPGKAAYSKYRDFVYEIEGRSPGITRQIMRAATRGGPKAAIRLIETIPDFDKLLTTYAVKLGYRMN